MASPPSPESVIDLPTPMRDLGADGLRQALAIDPWLNEPSSRRRPFIFR